MNSYLRLAFVAILPAAVAVILYMLGRRKAFATMNRWLRSLLIGIIYGVLAILGTEWGVPMNGAQVNCRDAAVLIAGLMFGAPAGIIAGVIGGLERWIAVAWGIGTFTRVACSVSTVIAGFYAAFLRKCLFENKKPGWIIAFASGVVMEVFHLTMVFMTNMDQPAKALAVVRACTAPMLIANGVSVLLAALALAVLAGDGKFAKNGKARIAQTIQRWLLLTVVVAFLATSFFVFKLQNTIATSQTDTLLNMGLQETSSDIQDLADSSMIELAKEIRDEIGLRSLTAIASKYDITELDIIDKNGIITESTEPSFVGYDMASGEQSAEFLCLLGTTEEYAQKYGPIGYDSSISRKYVGVKTDDGFLQVGFDARAFQKQVDKLVNDLTKNRHVGENGFILILNKYTAPVSAPSYLNFFSLQIDLNRITFPAEGTTFHATLNGSDCMCRHMISEGYYIISVLPTEEAVQMRNIALYVNAFLEVLVFAVLFGLIYLLIKRVVVNKILDVNHSLGKITCGDLNEVVDVRSNAEFASLSDDINSTVDTLKQYIADASARIDAELEFAKNIQASALPNAFPAFPKRKEFDIFASMNPAKEVGGDFYDFYMTDKDMLHFLIADVSGKGIPAAMFMMRAKTELKTLTESGVALNEVFTRGNAGLCEGNDAGMFVTAWQGSIDVISGIVTFANAGHNPPLVKRGDGKFEYLRSRAGFVLAGMDGVKYKTQEMVLQPGDIIYLYTDGVTEATNAFKELYGEDRLLNAINSQKFEDMQSLCKYIKSDVDAFVGEADQFDDITMVALRYLGPVPVPTIHFDEAEIENITEITEFFEAELEKLDCPMKTIIQFNVAIDELYSNIVRYGYPNRKGPVTIKLIYKEDPRRVYLRFEDEGIPYNPLNVAAPDVTLSAEERQIGGLGIYMVRKSMDNMKYKYENNHNVLTIKKFLE